jgi:hypothetical protein
VNATSCSRASLAGAGAAGRGLQEEANQLLNPVCHSQVLSHGRTMERAIIFMHGMTNCPQQYVELAPPFYERGYNVLIPRMPCNGLADLDTNALMDLTAEFDRLETCEFEATYRLIHDVIDPKQQEQQTALVYPVLLDLITRSMAV